jgi:hypothetical protein
VRCVCLCVYVCEPHPSSSPPSPSPPSPHLHAVGGRQEQHPGPPLEPIQLCQQLVQGLVPLVVVAHAAAGPDRIQLVDEDHAGGRLQGV